MMFLLAKMFLLLVLAAGLGFLLGRWWVRRQFVDVTDEHARLLSAAPGQDYSPAFEALGQDVRAGRDEITAKIGTIEGRLRDLVAAEISKRPLTTLETRLMSLEKGMNGLCHLGPVESMLSSMQASLAERPAPAPVDLSRVESGVASVQAMVAELATPATVDLSGLEARIAAVEAAVRQPAVDLEPLRAQLHRLETLMRDALQRPTPPPPGPVMLQAATFGPKDDLKRISGVGEVLERLLNELGVYYFFQVASWSPQDVQHVDNRLEAFKGRIRRDGWVEQAKQLARTSRAKPPPGLVDASFGLEPGAEYPTPATSTPDPDPAAAQ